MNAAPYGIVAAKLVRDVFEYIGAQDIARFQEKNPVGTGLAGKFDARISSLRRIAAPVRYG